MTPRPLPIGRGTEVGGNRGLIEQADAEKNKLQLKDQIADLERLIDRRKGELATEEFVAEKVKNVVSANDNRLRRESIRNMEKEIQSLREQLREKNAELREIP